jgi:GcvH upstream region-like protein
MLAFFRKYQRYFFIAITIVIVISFSFFGTYSTLTNTAGHEQTAFTAMDGTKISAAELDQLALFIGTDADDKMLFGGMWGPNFLNDGVIKKEFFQSGLAEILATAYAPDIESDLVIRSEKERKYSLYVHPQAKFVSVEAAWNYLEPDIKTQYEELRSHTNPISSEALKSRMKLYLAEKKLPAPLLRQVLLYQQQQYGWLNPDPNIERMDFSLFGYHTIEDWFGPRFVKLIAEFIINASIMAEQKGYQVSKSEALADLLYNSETSYKQMLNSPNLGVANSSEFFHEQLRRMQLSQNQAADIWRKVLLFRRWFNDVGSSVFVDPLMFEKFDEVAAEKAIGNLYQLPEEFRLSSFNDLQRLEVYFAAIGKQDEKSPLALPKSTYSIQDMVKNTPELIQKRYLIEIANVDKSTLQAKVGLKDTWNWEVDDANWAALQKQFVDLGSQNALTRAERFSVLDALDSKSRAKIDAFARKAIVDIHPEWIDQALSHADMQPMLLRLNLKGKNSPLQGLKDPGALMKLLDEAKLGEQDETLAKQTFDGDMYYRIIVKERTPDFEIATFAESLQNGSIDELLNKKLEAYYQEVREKQPTDFQKEDKTWKPFQEVKAKVAELYYATVLKTLRSVYRELNPNSKDVLDDIASSLRFYPYMKSFLTAGKKDSNQIASYLQPLKISESTQSLSPRASIEDQWKLVMNPYEAERGSEVAEINLTEAFKMPSDSWSSIQTPPNGDLSIFYLKSKEAVKNSAGVDQKISAARKQIADEAKRILMANVVKEIKDKGAISWADRLPEMSAE